MLVFVPVSIVLEVMHAGHVWIFIASALAIIPLLPSDTAPVHEIEFNRLTDLGSH